MIRTEDREQLHRSSTMINKNPDATYYWYCPHCSFHRIWETEGGAVGGVADHLMVKHHVKLTVAPLRKKKEDCGETPHTPPA